MKILSISIVLSFSIVLSLLLLFVGCGEDTEEAIDEPEDKMPDIATLTGSVTLEGENDHTGISVNLYSGESLINSSEADASGNYSIGLKQTGNYTLEFEEDGFVSAVQEITIAEGANSAEPVTLEPGGVITGTVSCDVQPDELQIQITITDEASGREFSAEPDRNGRYRLTVLPGNYTVIVEDATPDSKFPPFEENVEVKIGDLITVEAHLSTWPYFEAEDATIIKAPMVVREDPAASGGKYIVGDGVGYAIFEITVPEDGNYIIWGRVLAKDGGSDSFLIGVNVDEPSYAWDVPQGAWQWDKASNRGGPDPLIFEMKKGKNSITIKTREANTKLDKIFLTTSSSARP